MIDPRTSAMVQTGPGQWLTFREPVMVLQADAPEAVSRTIADVEQLTRDRGLHAVGFVAYEAAAAFGLPVRQPAAETPLAWFALYQPAHVAASGPPAGGAAYTLGPLAPSVDRREFGRAFDAVRAALGAGNSYQANYTFRIAGAFTGDALALFADLVEAQRGSYSAFLEMGEIAICSASPELFFEFHGAEIVARPMKGTAARGLTPDDDDRAGRALSASAKNRAENVMIVDMIRNDIGRVAEVGSVRVPELFAVERYPNVWQMTSTVVGRCTAPLDAVFAALHPSASVTGAPKTSTMRLLRDLERTPRGVYTGAVGHVPPDGLARFNVAIRTAVVDRRAGRVTFGVGSGIVWDSEASAEYDECLLKGSVLGRRPLDFELLETLRWSPGEGFFLLDRHLARLLASAGYFDVPVSGEAAVAGLAAAVAGQSTPQRLRLLVSRRGAVRVECQPLVRRAEPVILRLAGSPIDSAELFLYHKTTNRTVYDRARRAAANCDDVVLWNERGEVTETTTANLVAALDGEVVTPPVSCGLLPGTCRASLLASGEVVERAIGVEDLQRAERLWVINAVQGRLAAEFRAR